MEIGKIHSCFVVNRSGALRAPLSLLGGIK